MLNALKQSVYEANMALASHHLASLTWGNVSGIDRKKGVVVIKPSGVSYENLSVDDLVVVNMEGEIVEGRHRPSSDMPTHLLLYKEFQKIGSITQAHGVHAVSWAQAQKDIPCFGTTHADYFASDLPCTRPLSREETENDYEENIGHAIVDTFNARKLSYIQTPGILCANRGPFTWGETTEESVLHAMILEEVAKMALNTIKINPHAMPAPLYMQRKHFMHKHGENASYGQEKSTNIESETDTQDNF